MPLNRKTLCICHYTWHLNRVKRSDLLMSKQVMDRIEYLVLLVAEFAARSKVSEAMAYRYLNQYGALALCDKHYNVMHTLSVEENIQTLREYCHRRGGNL